MSTVAPEFRPIKLATIDVERCPESIDGAAGHEALWALVREHGQPRGMIRVTLSPAGRADAQQLASAIAALAPVAPRRGIGGELPSISVVIPSLLTRTADLQTCLRSLARLHHTPAEVIVVDNRPAGAPPVALAPVPGLPGLRLVREPRPGTSAARNAGLAAAQEDIVAFIDDDVEVDPGWSGALARRFAEHPEESCVTGLALPRELDTPAQVALEEYYGGFGPRTFEPVSHRLRPRAGRSPLTPATVDAVGEDGRVRRSFSLYAAGSFGAGANMAYRARALRAIGGFDPALGGGTVAQGGEDLVLFARLAWRGHVLGFEPAAIVHHAHRRDDAALERQIHGYGVGYGALLTALVLEDPRHLTRMLATAARAARAMRAGYRDKLDAEHHPDPRTKRLARMELRGTAAGPLAYLASRRRVRRPR